MSPRSSSGSWSGAARGGGGAAAGGGGGRAPDIIDLDRYMRGAVRPGARRNDDKCERLVVDAGGIGRKLAAAVSERSSSSEDSTPRERERDKRYSHDSGLSDGSYVRRRHREHRRSAGAALRLTREREVGSSSSMQNFRSACERALKEQQEQIARVAQICERLAVHRAPPAPPSADSTELSSSSRSTATRDQRLRDKRRSTECKTYKIIMSKLDDLNRMFAARGRSPPAPPARRRPEPPAPGSSASVSVSDKLVATEPVPKPATTDMRASYRSPRRLESRGASATGTGRGAVAGGESERRGSRPAPHQRYNHAPPAAPAAGRLPRFNVATESVVQFSSSTPGSRSGAGSACDLDDVHQLYAQAQRLQALHAHTRLARGSSSRASTHTHAPGHTHTHAPGHTHTHAPGHTHTHAPGHTHTYTRSLCALCRGYWRALTTCLASQLFSKENAC